MTQSPVRPTVRVDRRTVSTPDGTRLSVLVARPADPVAHAGPVRTDASPAEPPVPPAELPPVLAVHGFASSAERGWGRTGHLASLTGAGRLVIAPDLRGHGQSDRPHRPDSYTLGAMLEDLRAVFDQFGQPPAQVDLLGYSLGARLCWELVQRRIVPVRRMVLGGFHGRPLFEAVDEQWLTELADAGPGNDSVALRALVTGLAGSGGAATDGPLPDLPILLVAGTEDPLATGARDLAAALPHGCLLEIPGRNHVSAVPAAAFRRGAAVFLGAG